MQEDIDSGRLLQRWDFGEERTLLEIENEYDQVAGQSISTLKATWETAERENFMNTHEVEFNLSSDCESIRGVGEEYFEKGVWMVYVGTIIENEEESE